MYHPGGSPFGGWRHHLARWEACHWIRGSRGSPMNPVPLPPPAVRLVNQKEGPFMGRLRAYFNQLAHPMQDVHSGTITRAYCRAIYEESVSRCFILPPLAGEVRRSRKGGGERSEPIRRILCISYDTESQSRNADFISIARKGNPLPSAAEPLLPPERKRTQPAAIRRP